jgi:chaperonin GroES
MINPLPGYILVEPIKEDAQVGSIYLPQDTNDKPSKGKIVGIGVSRNDEDKIVFPFLEVGKTVVYKKWVNQEVKSDGKEYLLVKFDELLGVIE